MKFLNLNCQHGLQRELKDFLHCSLNTKAYDFLILQEVNDRVLTFLRDDEYQLIRAFNEETERDTELCIVYQRTYNLRKIGFKSFSSMRQDPVYGYKHPCMGLLWADFEIENKLFRVATIHLHSGIDRHVRIAESRLAKKLLLNEIPVVTILAGDFNAGLPFERIRLAQTLSPEFTWMTKNLNPTLNSRYSENVAHLPNRIAALFNFFNLGIKLRTDHIFVDHQTAVTNTVECSILPDRVSDHSPVEITLI